MIDFHCDVLYKLSLAEGDMQFRDDSRLHTNLTRLQQAGVKVQVFAIYVEPSIPQEKKYYEVLRQIELFHTHVIAPNPEMRMITEWSQINELQEGQIGAVLSLEGCDAIGQDIHKLHAILDAGIKAVGLTWNFENAVAHGALEDPAKGLKSFGEEVIEVLNERNIIVDVSHLNEQSFWDVIERANHLIASHSNARALCDNPRNLTNEQLAALANAGGHVHVVYYPAFIKEQTDAVQISDLIEQIVYIANEIGVHKVGLGSDFDGITMFVEGLEDASKTTALLEALRENYTKEQVESIAFGNFMSYLKERGL